MSHDNAMTTMDVSKVFYSRIEAAVATNESVANYLCDIYPQFRKRLLAKQYGAAELQSIMAAISNYSSSDYQSLVIVTRLFGGTAETARLINIPHEELLSALTTSSPEMLAQLIHHITESRILPTDFFQKNRIFFTESMLARFRRANITTILSTASDYHQVITTLAQELSPNEDVLEYLQQGKLHSRSHWACRRIEQLLGLDRGILDKLYLKS